MLIWHVHRKSCLAIDYDWFYMSNIQASSLHQPARIYCSLAFSWSQLSTKSSMKRKISSTAAKPVRKYQCFDVTRQSPGQHFPGSLESCACDFRQWVGSFSTAPKTYHPRRIGWFVIFRSWIQNSWMKMTFIWFFYRYFFVVDRSAVTGRFSLFLWVRDGVVQLPSWRASSRPEIALECKILSFSRTSRARMRFWKT